MSSNIIIQGSIQAAFIAISSRIVGSAFRCLETLNPELQKTRVISDPSTVFIRELVTISMAWGFALLTNIAIKPLAHRRGWSNFIVQFATAIVGTTIAESIGRFVAYRKALKEENRQEAEKHNKLSERHVFIKSSKPQNNPLTYNVNKLETPAQNPTYLKYTPVNYIPAVKQAYPWGLNTSYPKTTWY